MMATERREYTDVFWLSKPPKPATNPEDFKQFHERLTWGRPDYTPHYFALGKGEVVIQKRKDKEGETTVTAIVGKDPLVYGSWTDVKNRLTYKQAYKRLESGYNVGIAAMNHDDLAILDVDNMDMVGDTKPTLQVISRKRLGRHNFYVTNEPARDKDNGNFDVTAKDNISLNEAGELRACNEYVVAPGSFVPCGPTEYNNIPEEDRCNAGKYSLFNPIEPATITFNELPEIFKNKRIKDIQAAIEKEHQKSQKQKQDDRHSNSRLFELTAGDVLGYTYPDYDKFPSPLHGSSTGANASFTGPLLHCWRHNVSHSGYSLLAVLAGLYDCGEAGTPHKHAGVSYLKYDGEEIFKVWKYAKEHNHIPDGDPIPTKALIHYATSNGHCKESDIVDGWKLPAEAYNRTLAALREDGINPGRAPIGEVKEQKPVDWKTPLKQAVMDTQDADQEAKIRAAKDILFNVLAEMSPIARRETFLECVCKDLKLSNRAANDIYKNFEINTNPLNRCEWFTEKGKFVPPVMSDQIRGQYHFITLTDTKEIWVYDDKTGCYKPGGDVVIKQYAQQALDKHSKKSHVEETVYHVMNETFEDRSVFNSNLECINLQNGIYNIRTCMFEDHRPDAMFTYALPFKYEPNAVCSKFDELLTNCGVNKTLIYEIFAYCLVPGYPIQSLFIFSGDGGNGKGTVIRVLRRFLGEENIVGHSMQALEKNRYAMADLFGKLANICGDMPPTDVRDTSPIKTTTGGDAITAPVIYKGNITFENRAKMIFLLNHVPEFDDNTDSFDRRLVFQEFNNRVVGLDPDFNEADLWTEEELSGIFNKCIEALPDLLARGSFTGKMGIQETREYRLRKGNPIAAFVDDCTNYDDMKFSVAANTYAAYLKWCTQNRETCLTENVFGRKLLEKFPEFKKSRPIVDGKRVYCYTGFVLKEEYQNLNISEEAEKYVKSKDVVQDTHGASRHGLGTVQDKKSDFSDTIDGNGVFGLGYSSKLSLEENTNENNNEKDNANYLEEDRASILDENKKEATDNESILDGSWTDPRPNLDHTKIIEDALDLWEKTACPIFAKNAHRAKLDIVKYHKMYGINPQLIYEAVDKRAAGRCLDCGADNTNNVSPDGKRCDSCHKIYSNPPPVVIPREINLEEPAEVAP